jgi:hypothetical protein
MPEITNIDALEKQLRYAAIMRIKKDEGHVEIDLSNGSSLTIYVNAMEHGFVGAGLPVIRVSYVEPDEEEDE